MASLTLGGRSLGGIGQRGFELEGYKKEDNWWKASLLIDGFNKACSDIASSFLKVGDESMSAILFRTTSEVTLPQFSYIFRKPEPLGTEFKTVTCSITGDLIFFEIQKGKEGMKSIRYHLELGAAATCTKIFMDEMKGLGQRALKGSMRDCFLFDSWLFLKKASEAAASIGVHFIGMVKTNTKGFSGLQYRG